MRTTTSLRSEEWAQTGLRGGKLAAHYARIACRLRLNLRNPLIRLARTAIKEAMKAARLTLARAPGITARLPAARRPM
jgi:hypothetical protein